MIGKKRIADAFARCKAASKAALIPYMTTGYPDPSLTVPLMHAIVEAGADIIELGVPFSDPMADGAVIQAAGDHALSRGMSLSKVLDLVAEFRQTNHITPVVLMGYANPVEAMGADHFIQRAAQAGVDGVLVVDYPPEECHEFQQQLDRAGLAQIFLLSPTSSDERMANVAKMAQGYVYYVSLKGVTGAGNLDVAEVAQRVNRIREFVSIPVGVGFGIRDAQSAQAIAQTADAVVIGTRFIQVLEEAVLNKPEAQWHDAVLSRAKAWVQEISQALIK